MSRDVPDTGPDYTRERVDESANTEEASAMSVVPLHSSIREKSLQICARLLLEAPLPSFKQSVKRTGNVEDRIR